MAAVFKVPPGLARPEVRRVPFVGNCHVYELPKPKEPAPVTSDTSELLAWLVRWGRCPASACGGSVNATHIIPSWWATCSNGHALDLLPALNDLRARGKAR